MTNIKNNLIKINIIAFLITSFNKPFWFLKFGLVPELVIKKMFIWQLLTYSFLHANILHLLFNMLMLHFLGKDLELVLGKKLFLRYYLVSAMGSGLFLVFISNFFPSIRYVPTIGASGAIFSLFLAYALTFKNKIVYIWGIYPIKAFKLLIILIVIEFISIPSGSNISHLGHLGGILTGYIYIKYLQNKKKREKKEYKSTWQ